MHIPPLLDHSKDIILGSLLGDGSIAINKGYKNARFSFKHSIKQKEYFLWKVEMLKNISSEHNTWIQEKNGHDGWGSEKLRFQSLALEELTEIYNLTTEKGKKIVKRKWLNLLTPLSLLVWWLDDGSLVSNSRKGVFCTDGFSLKEVKILQNYLKKVWGIDTKIGKTFRESKIFFRLWITSTEELKKFLRVILPYLKVEQMLYKVLVLYNDSELQQRWISEASSLSGFSSEIVEKYISERKSRLKKFRE